MAILTAGQEEELTFLTGIDANGVVAKNTFRSWSVGERLGRAFIWKWDNDADGKPLAPTSLAGTGGGTVTYAFGDGLGANAQAAYEASLSLWSDVADIQFKKVETVASANMQFAPTTDPGGTTILPANGSVRTGAGVTQIPSLASPSALGRQARIEINGPDDLFNSFAPDASGLSNTVTHELGHAIGLGHGGRYNGDDYTGDAQLNVYDNQLWTLMSYPYPEDPNAKYFADYPVKGTNWTTATRDGSFQLSAETPMPLDILAAQRLYGASKTGTFAGGQTYGFNTNISGLSRNFFDFTKNADPVVTLYNRGTGNTLDLSGYSTKSFVNLNPGTFSSASSEGLLVNNIGIAYDTRIDRAVGGRGDDTFVTNGDGNVIDGGAGRDTVRFAGARANYAISTGSDGTTRVVDTLTGVTNSLTNVEDIQFDGPPVCFTTGTRIALVRDGACAEVAVEALRVGDSVLTAAGHRRTIRWIGHRSLGTPTSRVPAAQCPVRIRAGAFGRDAQDHPVPARDLRLSPGHPVLVAARDGANGGVLVPIQCLVNGTSIAREPVAAVTYWHVELDANDILLAEGLPAESYIDGGDRAFFAEASDHGLHDPDFVPPGWDARCRPVAVDGPIVDAERRRLDGLFATALRQACAWQSDTTEWLAAQVPPATPERNAAWIA